MPLLFTEWAMYFTSFIIKKTEKLRVSLFLRLTDYNGKVLASSGQYDNSINITNTVDPSSTQFIEIISYSNTVEQALNIGSQSTGAGAGKITFNPMAITRMVNAVSPICFRLLPPAGRLKWPKFFW